MVGFATRFDLVLADGGGLPATAELLVAGAPPAFGLRVRFGFGSEPEAVLATSTLSVGFAPAAAGGSTSGPVEAVASGADAGANAGRGRAQTGAISAGSNNSWRKIAAGRRTGGGPNGTSSAAIGPAASVGSSAVARSPPGRRRVRSSNRLNGMARAYASSPAVSLATTTESAGTFVRDRVPRTALATQAGASGSGA